jgi:formylglycine-generating enzyme required for sulfatase activity
MRGSWQQAMAFCRWLSERTAMRCDLPTEAQWEYACRAGCATPLSFGRPGDDFSAWANLADKSLSRPSHATGALTSNLTHERGQGISLSAMRGGNVLCDNRFDDGVIATAEVGRFKPNAWGLLDMHGNAAEWTRTAYRPYPYDESDGRNDASVGGEKVVRGGSFCDRPQRASSAFRLAYPAWQRVHNVGFRVVCQREAAHN